MRAPEQHTDYLIIGAGSAGCVIASRLSETGANIVLLEAGPPDRSPLIHVPAGVLKLVHHPVLNWNYKTDPDPAIGNRQIDWPRGKTLGGSSSINGMLWVRGNSADYDRWAQMGALGWSYEDVLPYFKSIERYQHGGNEFRGGSGPLSVQEYREIFPLTHAFVAAGQEVGYKKNPDLNGEHAAEGVGYTQLSHQGRWRASSAQTFLKQARGRANLQVETNALATRLLFDGQRCIGAAIRQNGQERKILARREVILSGGAINSPQLLQISGVGPAELLARIGVPMVHDLPGVGQNLCDHYACRVVIRVKNAATLNNLGRGWRAVREAAKYALFGTGALGFGVTTAQLFGRTRPGLAAPDVQILFTPCTRNADGTGLEREPGMTCSVSIANPESRGVLEARSADPTQYPSLRPNYLATRGDVATLIAGIRLVRDVFAAKPFAPYVAREMSPGPDMATDDQLEAFARAAGSTIFHQSGTCRIGTDPMAVVDPSLKVHGLEGLRVADASVMPAVTTGNTNATCIMIGEKAAAMIAAAG
jgi:choline dehydrogenase